MKFKFIGKDGSMGFVNGYIYNLQVLYYGLDNKKIMAYLTGEYVNMQIPYDTKEAFEKNWKAVK